MARFSSRKTLELQKQMALKQLNERHEELERIKQQYSEMLRRGRKSESQPLDHQ